MNLSEREKQIAWDTFIATPGVARGIYAAVEAVLAEREGALTIAVDALEELSRLGNGNMRGNSFGNDIAIRALDQIEQRTPEQPAAASDVVEEMLQEWESMPSDVDGIKAMHAAYLVARKHCEQGEITAEYAVDEAGERGISVSRNGKRFKWLTIPYEQGRCTLEQIEAAIGANTRTRQEVEKIRGMMRHESYDLAESAIEIILEGRRKRLQPAPKPRVTVREGWYEGAPRWWVYLDGRQQIGLESKTNAERYAAGLRQEIGDTK